MPVDPALRALLDQVNAVEGPTIDDITPEQARQQYKLLVMLDGPGEEVAEVRESTVPGPAGEIPIRVYRPAAGDGEPLPVLVWLPGGGWVLHDLDTGDPTARRMANCSGALVVLVGYRAAPEHPFPAAVEDAWAALRWVADHAGELGGDPSRLAVGGESAGGNLSAVLALRARDEGGPMLALQVLVYPVTDCTLSQPSVDENAEGYLLTKRTMAWFARHYLGPEGDRRDPRASPLHAADLSGVAPAYVVTAQYDPLRDEGDAYARRLAEAGVPVEHVRYDGMTHQFFILGSITAAARAAAAAAGEALRRAFAAVGQKPSSTHQG